MINEQFVKPESLPQTAENPSAEKRDLREMVAQLTHDLDGIAEYVNKINNTRKRLFFDLLGGAARGIGAAVGFTLFAVLCLYVLRMLGALNLPIIGDYIADIVLIVQNQLEGRRF